MGVHPDPQAHTGPDPSPNPGINRRSPGTSKTTLGKAKESLGRNQKEAGTGKNLDPGREGWGSTGGPNQGNQKRREKNRNRNRKWTLLQNKTGSMSKNMTIHHQQQHGHRGSL